MLETERTLLRNFKPGDLNKLVAHRSDSRVMAYLGGIQDPETVKNRLNYYSEYYDKNGYAMCAVIWRETGEFIGVGGLQKFTESGGIEVGYTIEKRFWGKGIATEITLACLDYGFKKAGLDRINALTHANNAASKRVLEKCGMKKVIDWLDPGRGFEKYTISNYEYDANSKIDLPRI